MSNLIERLKTIYKRIDARTGGRLEIVVASYLRFLDLGGPEAAAGMAYYALFSIFPLTLLMVSVLGFVLSSDLAYNQALRLVLALFPFSEDLITQNLGEVLEKRTAIGLLGLVGLAWAASGFFTLLARNVNRAWPSVKLQTFLQSRLAALIMVGVLFLLLLLSLISSTLLGLMPTIVRTFGFDEAILESSPWRAILRLVPPVFTLLLFIALYLWVPNKSVNLKPALIGAGITALVWELAKSVFTLYLSSGYARYEIVYGSLGTLITLMVWIYVSNVIALFGAHLVATLDLRADHKKAERLQAKETPPLEMQTVEKMHKEKQGAAHAPSKPGAVESARPHSGAALLEGEKAHPARPNGSETVTHGRELEKSVSKGVRG